MPRRAGFSLIELLVVLAIIGVLLGLLLSTVHGVLAAASRTACANNLRQIGLAAHQHHDTLSVLPSGVRSGPVPSDLPWLSWHARLLPWLEQEALWRETLAAYHEQPYRFFNDRHRPGGAVLRVFGCPGDARTTVSYRTQHQLVALTSYQGVQGRDRTTQDGLLYLNSSVAFAQIADGLSNTLLVGERPPSADRRFGWWYAGVGFGSSGTGDMVLGVRELNPSAAGSSYGACPPGPYHFSAASLHDPCGVFRFWSLHPRGSHFLVADGSVRFVSYDADAVLPALASRAGGEPQPLP
ncbi:MAG: DUF1559 domain-containing protein [Gemmataceae bacterium]|nr:DUF1559 domain-containing protein [Gemmataceae bacterium]